MNRLNKRLQKKVSIYSYLLIFILLEISVLSFETIDNRTEINGPLSNNTDNFNNTGGNATSNNTEIITLEPPKLISRNFIKNSNNCQENLLLLLLPFDLRSRINKTLLTFPEENKLNYCNANAKKTCCTSNTIDEFLDDINTNSILLKQNIFNKNLNVFYKIINEHSRNYLQYFNFNQTQFNFIFEKYKTFTDTISLYSQQIVQESLLFKWNSYCNYICDANYQTLCDVYNLTYSYNNTIYSDLSFECNLANDQRFSFIQNTTNLYINEMRNINTTLENIYNLVSERTNVSAIQRDETINSTKDNETYTYLVNSMKDGLYVSKKTGKNLICEGNSFNLTNSNLGNYTSKYNITCEEVTENVCLPFECMDNSFMQFNDYSNQILSSIIINSNYTKIQIKSNRKSTDNNTFKYHDKDIFDKVNASILFVSSQYFTFKTIFIYNLITLIFIIY